MSRIGEWLDGLGRPLQREVRAEFTGRDAYDHEAFQRGGYDDDGYEPRREDLGPLDRLGLFEREALAEADRDRVYDPALGGERALTDREADEVARAADRQALHRYHDDGDPRDGIELRLELAHAEAARDRAERADPATAAIVEARDLAAAGGRFDVADSKQRVIDVVREPDTRNVGARGLSAGEHGAVLRAALGAEPGERRDEPTLPVAREVEPEVREQ